MILKIGFIYRNLLNPLNLFFVIVFSLIFFLSCAKSIELPDISNFNSNELVKTVAEKESLINTVKGIALVRLKSPEKKVSFKQVTIVKDPNILRLEALAPFGRTVAMVISDGTKVSLEVSSEKLVFYRVEDFNFSDFYGFIPVKIGIQELTDFLLGKIPVHIFNDKYNLGVDEKEGLILLESKTSKNIIWINHNYVRVAKASIYLENGDHVNVSFNKFREIEPELFFPFEMELKYEDFSIYVKYDYDVDINKNIRDDLFLIN